MSTNQNIENNQGGQENTVNPDNNVPQGVPVIETEENGMNQDDAQPALGSDLGNNIPKEETVEGKEMHQISLENDVEQASTCFL